MSHLSNYLKENSMATAPKKGAPAPKAAAKPAAAPAASKGNGESTKEPGVMSVTATLSEATMKEKYGGAPSPTVTVDYNFGTDLDDSVAKFGADVVYNSFVDRAVINLQGMLRRVLHATLDPEKPVPLPKNKQDLVAEWTPSAGAASRKTPAEKISVLVGKLSDEDRAALIARLKSGA
jgi:hypothetical protein